ncbi:hypothetical protein KGM_208194 [Danaus plexippus plexippus]|uniref:Uncharacterized protein n=1 Tax=Danaus plexippus plexippus TaxID=278856 RepID=A0A212FED4_DANPL|nr:hypothetical protein KGM_208194 [Danaus plexippus plexippus]
MCECPSRCPRAQVTIEFVIHPEYERTPTEYLTLTVPVERRVFVCAHDDVTACDSANNAKGAAVTRPLHSTLLIHVTHTTVIGPLLFLLILEMFTLYL